MKKMKNLVSLLLCAISLTLTAVSASSNDKKLLGSKPQIIVRVHSGFKELLVELESPKYKNAEYAKGDANYVLAELKLHEGGDCQVIEIFDDGARLSAIAEVSEMAINAGFKDIRPFIYWHKTGQMAEVQFGSPIKYTTNADKLEQRTERAK
jgi:hypothetical protein